MDLSVALRLRAQAEGTSAIKAMREETVELAAAMKEVRQAARMGGMVSPNSIKALGGFAEFQKAMAGAQRELAAGVRSVRPFDEEKAFRARLRLTDQQAKVRLAESARTGRAEAADAKAAADAEKREAEGVLVFRQRMWAQQAREAEAEARAETRAAERAAAAERRAAEDSLRANMAYWRQRGEAARSAEAEQARAAARQSARMRNLFWGAPGFGGGGHQGRGGRSILGELGLAAEYTLTYGAINEALQGVSAVARAPFALGKMTLGVADQGKGAQESAAALGVSTRDYQNLRYAFAGRGLGEDRVQPMLQFMEKSSVGALRGIKSETVAFRALGMSMRQLKADSHDPMKMLLDIGDRLEKIQNPSKRTAIADMIFGRDGSKYLPLFDHGYLRHSAAEAEASGATMSDSDISAGRMVSEQWRGLTLQVAGIRNEVAGQLFPIMSQLFGDASGWLKENRAVISGIIKTDIAELKADLPTIEAGFRGIANASLQIARDLAPALHAMTAFANSGFAKYMFSGQLVPGGANLGDPKSAKALADERRAHPLTVRGAVQNVADLDQVVARFATAIAAKIVVNVHASPGVAVGATTATGAHIAVHKRGVVHTG